MNTLEIRQTDKTGKGLYSPVYFNANCIILQFKGKIVDKQTERAMPPEQSALLLQISPEKYLDVNGDISFFTNHNCNPNCTVKLIGNYAFIMTIRPIFPNEELCFDYSITSTDSLDEWQMNCQCGAWNCRKLISGFKYLSAQEKDRYIKLGIVPDFLKS